MSEYTSWVLIANNLFYVSSIQIQMFVRKKCSGDRYAVEQYSVKRYLYQTEKKHRYSSVVIMVGR